MYKQCTTEKSAEQQRRLELELLQQMGRISYEAISVSGLCANSGLSRKTFYRLFGNKDDVLMALVDHTLTDFGAFMTRDALSERGEQVLIRFLDFWKEQKGLLSALCQNQKSSLLVQRTLNHIIREEGDVLRYLGFSQSRRGYDILLFYVSGIMSMVIAWHNDGYNTPVEELAKLMTRLIMTAGSLKET